MNLKSLPAYSVLALALLAGLSHADGKHDDDIGKPGSASQAVRTVQIDMSDAMRFTPSSIDVRQGETVRFVVKNSGKVKHEMVLGTEKALKAHDELMTRNPGMEHADENMVTVAPGKTGEIVWQFTKAGRIEFACLQPGHLDAGMKGAVTVSAGVSTPKDGGHADHKH